MELIKKRSYSVWAEGLIQYDWRLYKKKRRDTATDTHGERHVTTDAETGPMQLQAKDFTASTGS